MSSFISIQKGFRRLTLIANFGEALRLATEKLDQKNVYMINPAFDSAPGQAKNRRGS